MFGLEELGSDGAFKGDVIKATQGTTSFNTRLANRRNDIVLTTKAGHKVRIRSEERYF